MLKKYFCLSICLSLLTLLGSCNKDDEMQIEPSQTEVSLSIVEITDVQSSTANVKFSMLSSLNVLQSGISWSEGMNPIEDENLTLYSDSSESIQTLQLFGTAPDIQYFVRAFAITPNGTLYSENVSFTTNAICSEGVSNQDFTLTSQSEVNELGALNICGINFLNINSDNPSDPIVDLSPLSSIRKVNVLTINGNNEITSLAGLENMSHVRLISISNNNALVDLNGLNGLNGVVNGIIISNNENLISLAGLENISLLVRDSVYDGVLFISSNENLKNLDGLNGLREIYGFVDIFFNPSLESLTGLDNLRKFDGSDFSIFDNFSLLSIDGLNNLQIIKGNLFLRNNENLEDITALSNLTVANYIYIRNLPSLTNINGLENIDIGSMDDIQFYIWQNDSLTDISAFSNYIALGVLSIIDCPVEDFSPLSNVVMINYNLSLRNVNVLSLSGFTSLESVGRIFFTSLNNLENLSGLETLSNVGTPLNSGSSQNGNIEIYDSKNLNNFCALEEIIIQGEMDGVFITNSNAYNPTQQDIIDGNCSQ